MYICDFTFRRLRQEDCELKSSLSYIMSSGSSPGLQNETVSKDKNKTKGEGTKRRVSMGRSKFSFLFSWVGDNIYFCNMDK